MCFLIKKSYRGPVTIHLLMVPDKGTQGTYHLQDMYASCAISLVKTDPSEGFAPIYPVISPEKGLIAVRQDRQNMGVK